MTDPWDVDAHHEGEVIVVRVGVHTFRLKIEDAERLKSRLLDLPEAIADAISFAKGINPRSGDPI